jgi:hypothetical protein
MINNISKGCHKNLKKQFKEKNKKKDLEINRGERKMDNDKLKKNKENFQIVFLHY